MTDYGQLAVIREWLRQALMDAGATDGGGSGFGFGQADIDIEFNGRRYNISIRPLDSDMPRQ